MPAAYDNMRFVKSMLNSVTDNDMENHGISTIYLKYSF